MELEIYDEMVGRPVGMTIISYVNGVVIGVDETMTEDEELDNYERIDDQRKLKSASGEHKTARKNPEDNLGEAVATLDTAEIERGVDFEEIFSSINDKLAEKNIGYAEFFSDPDILADYCEYYNYSLLNFIRLFMEHRPDIMTLDFIKRSIKPTVSEMQKRKKEFENEVEGCQYRRIFAHL